MLVYLGDCPWAMRVHYKSVWIFFVICLITMLAGQHLQFWQGAVFVHCQQNYVVGHTNALYIGFTHYYQISNFGMGLHACVCKGSAKSSFQKLMNCSQRGWRRWQWWGPPADASSQRESTTVWHSLLELWTLPQVSNDGIQWCKHHLSRYTRWEADRALWWHGESLFMDSVFFRPYVF